MCWKYVKSEFWPKFWPLWPSIVTLTLIKVIFLHEVFIPLCTSVILPNINFLRIIITKPWAFRSLFSDCQISHDLWPLTSISAMLHPPKPTNRAQIPIWQVFYIISDQTISDPLDFLIFAFWPCGSPTIPHDHHTSPSTDIHFWYLSHLPDDCHTSCQVMHLLKPFYLSPWPSHLTTN